MRIIKRISVLLLAVTMLGCSFMEYSDISNEEPLSHLLYTNYKSLKETFIYGITTDKNYKKTVNYYTIIVPPGIGGPEVLSKDILPKGTLIKIIGIERCSNCFPFPAEERLIVEILSSNKFEGQLVEIDLDRINIEETDVFIKIE